MNGYCAKRTARHVIEPLGYGLLRKTVRRGALVNSALDQYTIHAIASEFRSEWFRVLPPISNDSPRSYILHEHVDCESMTADETFYFLGFYDGINEEYAAFKTYMIREGYFLRGLRFLRRSPSSWTRPPLYVIDFSLCGSIQGSLVRFPDLPWTYSIIQAELLFGSA